MATHKRHCEEKDEQCSKEETLSHHVQKEEETNVGTQKETKKDSIDNKLSVESPTNTTMKTVDDMNSAEMTKKLPAQKSASTKNIFVRSVSTTINTYKSICTIYRRHEFS